MSSSCSTDAQKKLLYQKSSAGAGCQWFLQREALSTLLLARSTWGFEKLRLAGISSFTPPVLKVMMKSHLISEEQPDIIRKANSISLLFSNELRATVQKAVAVGTLCDGGNELSQSPSKIWRNGNAFTPVCY